MLTPPIKSPRTLNEALELRSQSQAKIVPFVGGTDIFVHLRNNRLECDELLNLSHIDELSFISLKENFLEIGPSTTHAEIIASQEVLDNCRILRQAVAKIGSPQIRLRGTIGGNICNASPAGDAIPPLYVRNAIIVIKSLNNTREVVIDDFITGPGITDLQSDELVTSIRIPIRKPTRGVYLSLRQRRALACNKVSVAVETLIMDGSPTEFRIACGAVSPTVLRVPNAEELLNMGEFDYNKISDEVTKLVEPIDDMRSSAEYRRAMTGVLTVRAVKLLIS